MTADAPARPDSRLRPLDARGDRVDLCPTCGGERQELPRNVVADVFYCEVCKRGTTGPNTEAPAEAEPEQIDLFGATIEVPKQEHPAEEAPPIDEGEAWMADEMPDE